MALFDAYRQFYEQPADLALAATFIHLRNGDSILWVAHDARGQQVGSALLQAAETQAAVNGIVRPEPTTAKPNHTAQRLYERPGWTRDDVFYTYSRSPTPPTR